MYRAWKLSVLYKRFWKVVLSMSHRGLPEMENEKERVYKCLIYKDEKSKKI